MWLSGDQGDFSVYIYLKYKKKIYYHYLFQSGLKNKNYYETFIPSIIIWQINHERGSFKISSRLIQHLKENDLKFFGADSNARRCPYNYEHISETVYRINFWEF